MSNTFLQWGEKKFRRGFALPAPPVTVLETPHAKILQDTLASVQLTFCHFVTLWTVSATLN